MFNQVDQFFFSSWWFQSNWIILVKLEYFCTVRGEHLKKYICNHHLLFKKKHGRITRVSSSACINFEPSSGPVSDVDAWNRARKPVEVGSWNLRWFSRRISEPSTEGTPLESLYRLKCIWAVLFHCYHDPNPWVLVSLEGIIASDLFFKDQLQMPENWGVVEPLFSSW